MFAETHPKLNQTATMMGIQNWKWSTIKYNTTNCISKKWVYLHF